MIFCHLGVRGKKRKKGIITIRGCKLIQIALSERGAFKKESPRKRDISNNSFTNIKVKQWDIYQTRC